jgi:Ca2+-binding EF-hand superfamily protein
MLDFECARYFEIDIRMFFIYRFIFFLFQESVLFVLKSMIVMANGNILLAINSFRGDSVTPLSDEKRKEISDMFKVFEEHYEGLVGVEKVPTMLRAIGYDVGVDDVTAFVEVNSTSGRIAEYQFLNLIEMMRQENARVDALKEGFNVLDKEKSGSIRAEDAVTRVEALWKGFRFPDGLEDGKKRIRNLILTNCVFQYGKADLNEIVRDF